MANNQLEAIQGQDKLLYIRPLSKQGIENAILIPLQTSLTFDPSRKVTSTSTKSGTISARGTVETKLEADIIESINEANDQITEALIDDEKLEAWVVYRKRVKDGKVFAWYMQGYITEDSEAANPDANATRKLTFTVEGTPKRGWTKLPDDLQEELDYVFKGLGVADDGIAFDYDKDKGAGSNATSAKNDDGKQTSAPANA